MSSSTINFLMMALVMLFLGFSMVTGWGMDRFKNSRPDVPMEKRNKAIKVMGYTLLVGAVMSIVTLIITILL